MAQDKSSLKQELHAESDKALGKVRTDLASAKE